MRSYTLLSLLVVLSATVCAQSSAGGPLHVMALEVSGLRNDNGHVAIQLLDENDEVIKEGFLTVDQGVAHVEFADLRAGAYSIQYFHDENDNKEMDTNYFGIPKEGFGFSNDAHGLMGPPSEEKRTFQLSTDTSITLTVKYF